ncbi:guanine nucleotide-binding protein G(i) subunit alpha-1-like [Symsagittifera roscoffensis]|uniref:guanine nucleotide-binding protein G(i) subunit alpha-1-like n=1 Tax=Symsagittifera roscoffensis TaxID=84072 RepID=UPI00307C89D6
MCLRDLFPCLGRENDIDRGIKDQEERMRRTISILLLGTAECGKSTVLKQMERKYNRAAFEEQRKICAKVAKLNLIMATWQLLDARDAFGYSSDDPALENRFRDKTEFLSPSRCNVHTPPRSEDEDKAAELYPRIAQEIKTIWQNASIVATLDRKSEFYMLDSAQYFMSRIDDVKSPNYNPTDEDVLKARKQTSGIVDVKIDAKLARDKVIFQITDVGGQRYERKYWSRVMSGVETTSILYIFSLSDYNLDVLEMLPERKRNRMIENTQVFNSVINKDEFRNKNVIVFLNKTDIFIEKLKHVPLTVCYSDYPENNRDPSAAMDFIEGQIRSQDRSATAVNEDGSPVREIVFHRTHATDPEAFQVIVETVLANIQAENLKSAGLLY